MYPRRNARIELVGRVCQQVQDRKQESKRQPDLKQEDYATTTKNDRTDTRSRLPSVTHGACDFGLRILIFAPSMARLKSWVICCNVRSCQTSERTSRQKHTEKNNPILKMGEYFTGSLVSGSFASPAGVSGGGGPKSTSFEIRQLKAGAKTIGDCERLVCLLWV